MPTGGGGRGEGVGAGQGGAVILGSKLMNPGAMVEVPRENLSQYIFGGCIKICF